VRETINIAGVPFVQLMKRDGPIVHADTIPKCQKCYRVFGWYATG
jgi:hypothetical protein